MSYSVNTTPLLQEFDTDNENEDEIIENEVVVRDNQLFKPTEPKDKYYLAYIIFYLLGIVTLLPWNFFITADDYWLYKFRDTHQNQTEIGLMKKRSPLQASFTSYISIASSVPNLVFLIFNTAVSQRISLNKRVIGSLVMMLILFIVTLVFVNINTDKWQKQFFILTITTIVLLNGK